MSLGDAVLDRLYRASSHNVLADDNMTSEVAREHDACLHKEHLKPDEFI